MLNQIVQRKINRKPGYCGVKHWCLAGIYLQINPLSKFFCIVHPLAKSNIAMENPPCIVGFPIETFI